MRRREVLTLVPLSSLAADNWRPAVLSEHQNRTVDQLSERIIPRTETPGASDVKVNRYIDQMLKAGLEQKEREHFLSGLEWLDKYCRAQRVQPFADLDEAGQAAALTAMQNGEAGEEGVRFFRQMKDLTLRGYYTSREGLLQELEYRGNGVYTSYPGCTHPEHQK